MALDIAYNSLIRSLVIVKRRNTQKNEAYVGFSTPDSLEIWVTDGTTDDAREAMLRREDANELALSPMCSTLFKTSNKTVQKIIEYISLNILGPLDEFARHELVV